MPGCQQPMIRRRSGRCRRSRPDIPAATVPPPRSPLRPPPVLLRRRTRRRRLSATEHRRERDHVGAGRSCFDGEVRYRRRCGSFDAEPAGQRRRRPPERAPAGRVVIPVATKRAVWERDQGRRSWMPTLIQSNPAVMMGKPVVTGTRITVELILEKLSAGETMDEVLEAHPRLTREAVLAALGFAARSMTVPCWTTRTGAAPC